VKAADIYILHGDPPLSDAALAAVKAYLINPADSREAPDGFHEEEPGAPRGAGRIEGFAAPGRRAGDYGLAMSDNDLKACQAYFAGEQRDPTEAELRVIDAYWSDHCRHTTFTTALDSLVIPEGPLAQDLRNALARYEAARDALYLGRPPPRSLMDMAVIGGKVLKKQGLLGDLDESKEVNACTLRISASFDDGSEEPWLLLFKNETHNHPTEIEPFGGAATCLGGAIRDPLSGRAFVYQAMRVSGGADPREAGALEGKLPQRTLARSAAAGYSSYGNQIGVATGQVAEFYHPGFLAKRLELGAVIGAAPCSWVRREDPAAGDVVVLLGGKTGRDGIGGAAGSSKAHNRASVKTSGAEVQKGNPLEERKLQRLFRNPEAARLIKRCNDFGAGGVSVAVGELAPGVAIDLDAIPKKYAGLDGVELALSESQERMAAAASPEDAEQLIRLAARENLDGTVIARITHGEGEGPADARLRMAFQGEIIVDLSRRFLDTSGAPRSARAELPSSAPPPPGPPADTLDGLAAELGSLRSGSRRGLQERFDGSVGAGSVLFPWGGAEQGTPECGMAALIPAIPSEGKESRSASVMAFGYDPLLCAGNPYLGGKAAALQALAKSACLGADPFKSRLSLQEYFPRPETPEGWGLPAAALLGALEVQLALGVPAVGGKDSMSGTYRDPCNGVDLAVPPTLIAFAAGTVDAALVRSGALSGEPGNPVILIYQTEGDTDFASFKASMQGLLALAGAACAAYPVGPGGIAASLALMAFGNMAGVEARAEALALVNERTCHGAALVEISAGEFERAAALLTSGPGRGALWETVARTIKEPVFRICHEGQGKTEERLLQDLRRAYESPLLSVYPQAAGPAGLPEAEGLPEAAQAAAWAGKGAAPSKPVPRRRSGPPLVVLPVFPGTNCEWDMERAFRRAGAEVKLAVFRNRTQEDIRESLAELAQAIGEARIIALSGGFSAGDEPDGSGKFIAAVFRAPRIQEAVTDFLTKREGLMLGICNGFQALIKLGLVPYGAYREADGAMPTLAFNTVGRHVSRMVRTVVVSTASPWLAGESAGAVHTIPVSHGEGRLVIGRDEAEALFRNGQVPFCYADREGRIALEGPDNPNGSAFGIEALTDPSGRILGKMGHSERCGPYVHRNITGNKHQRIFEAGASAEFAGGRAQRRQH
jgi:phosphoribosylformylglycinamidine synthase